LNADRGTSSYLWPPRRRDGTSHRPQGPGHCAHFVPALRPGAGVGVSERRLDTRPIVFVGSSPPLRSPTNSRPSGCTPNSWMWAWSRAVKNGRPADLTAPRQAAMGAAQWLNCGRVPDIATRRAASHLAEGTRRRGLGRERPLRRCNRPNRQLGSERPAADYPLVAGGNLWLSASTCRPPCFVVLHEWEWPGDRRFRLPTGSWDVTIDGQHQTLCQLRRQRILDGGRRATGRADRG
jgi:hypothetical protein